MAQTFQKDGQPVISVDTKKKDPIGNFKNAGQEWQTKNVPELVRIYNFIEWDHNYFWMKRS